MLRALLAASLLLLSACVPKDQMEIREGLLQLNIRMQAFLNEWGKPDTTSVTTGDEIMAAGFNGYGGSFFKGKQTYEVWTYTSKKTSLVFFRSRLGGWKTEETVQELAKPGY